MDLLELNNRRAFPTVHALMIEPFKSMWERDPDQVNHSNAIKVFSLVELLCSPKKSNPFFGVAEEKRMARVKKEVYGDENYKTTDNMIQAIAKYKELLITDSPSYDLFEAGIMAKDKLKNFLSSMDLNAVTGGGTLLLKPKDVTAALKEIPDVAKKLEEGRTLVNQELLETSKTRNQREVGYYER